MKTYIDRVETGTVLVLGGNGQERRTITVWRGGSRWYLTDEGMDVASRAGMQPAINEALRRLGVDPKDPEIERTDER